MATIFPDIEPVLVTCISSGLQSRLENVTNNVTVSVKKPDGKTLPYPERIVTVRSDGGAPAERDIVKRERIGVNVYAKTYKDASDLARIVDSILRSFSGSGIKLVQSVLSPVAVPNDGSEEQRYSTYEVVVVATDT